MLSPSNRAQSKYYVHSFQGRDVVLGEGAYGTVFSCIDSTGRIRKPVAVKQIKSDIFTTSIDSMRLYREIKILRALGAHENIISLQDIEAAESHGQLTAVNLVFFRYPTDLGHIIGSSQALEIGHIELLMTQIFRAVFYIHSANIVHRDLKPANILINSDCHLVICDFGLARPIPDVTKRSDAATADADAASATDSSSSELTQYIVTRWYRSPELILNNQKKAQPSDIWSVGCIFAELFLRTPIFNGSDAGEVLLLINDLIESDQKYLANYEDTLRKRFESKFKDKTIATNTAIDLLIKLLTFDPNARATARDALDHSFLERYVSQDSIPEFSSGLDEGFLAFETQIVKTRREIHERILREAESYNPRPPSAPPASPLATQSIFSSAPKKSRPDETREEEQVASANLT